MVRSAFAACLILLICSGEAKGRVILQLFETEWREVEARIPEISIAGYEALWLPPPQKGAEGVRDVGFSVYDRFDLGDVDQRGTLATRYGTRTELVSMTDAAHRQSLRVLFDVVMNHNGNPSLIENQGVDLPTVGLDGFPDTQPLDYHVLACRPTSGGAFEALRPSPLGGGTLIIAPGSGENPEAFVAAVPSTAVAGWSHVCRAPRVIFDGDLSVFENQSYSLLGLADFALDLSGQNGTLGIPLPSYVRQPDCPACYPGGVPVSETIVEYLLRWIVWLAETTGADGFRLDAVRHAPTDFFVVFNQAVKDEYLARTGSDAAQLFGESFTGDIDGELKAYYETGMQMLNFPLFFGLDGLLSSGAGGGGDLGQLSFPQGGEAGALREFGGLGRRAGVSFVQSHDSPPPSGQPNLAYAFIMSRVGDAVVFWDGGNPDARSFVQPGRPDALGELGSRTILDLIRVHDSFARGGMWNRFVDDDAYVFERISPGGPTLLAVLSDNLGADARAGADGVQRFGAADPRPLLVTAFPPGTVLVDVTGNSPLHEVTVLDPASVSAEARARALAEHDRSSDFGPPAGYGLVAVAVPSGPDRGYAMYAPRVPAGPRSGARALSLLQADQRVPDVTVRTAEEKRTASGARIPARDLTMALVTGQSVTLRLRTDATAIAAYARLDAGRAPLAGVPAVTGSVEGVFDGHVVLRAAGNAGEGDVLWELGPIDVSGLADGVHVIHARAERRAEGGATVWASFALPFVVDRTPGAGPPIEPLDRDGDGVPTADDVCPDAWNPEQADFDADRVGDLCDLCPSAGPAPLLDGDGCRALNPAQAEAVHVRAREVLAGSRPLVDLVSTLDEVAQ